MRIFFLFCLFLSGQILGATATEHAVVYFSPQDQVEKRLISMIEKEKSSISVAIYCLTHRGIAAALVDAKKRGVAVDIVVDRFSVKVKSPLGKMVAAGIPVHVWDPDPDHRKKAHRPLMHNKFCIFGDDLVWTGSFNFTYEGARMHEENVVVIRDAALAAAYKNQLTNIKLKSCTPFSSYVAYKK
jgi:cardiolipin hydrolase